MALIKQHFGNLLQNASFEAGLSFWQAENAGVTNGSPAEGAQAAGLWAGVSSLYQVVALPPLQRNPLFLSFIAYTQEAVGAGSLTAEILWLDADFSVIGTGLRSFIPASAINNVRITYFDVTEVPPFGAVWVKLLFSKGQSDIPVILDLIHLALLKSPNLVQNPSFEYGLDNWAAENITPTFALPYTGAAVVSASAQAAAGGISQTIPLRLCAPGAAYLLSFAAQAGNTPIEVIVRWLNILGSPVGDPAIDVTVPAATLSQQGNYLNIVQLTSPAPLGTVSALLELRYSGNIPLSVSLDQVIFVQLDSPNLLANPGFALQLDNWLTEGVTIDGVSTYIGAYSASLSAGGAYAYQVVSLPRMAFLGYFLFNFALRFSGSDAINGQVLAQVHWLDQNGREIGLGASLNIAQSVQDQAQWQVYTAFTERPPLNATFARIQFTRSQGGETAIIHLDSVTFAKVV